MQKDDRGQEKKEYADQPELSAVWRELLGSLAERREPAAPTDAEIPTLASDPWTRLVQEQGIEIVDLHKNLLHIDDSDLEQLLQRMQERSGEGGDAPSSRSS